MLKRLSAPRHDGQPVVRFAVLGTVMRVRRIHGSTTVLSVACLASLCALVLSLSARGTDDPQAAFSDAPPASFNDTQLAPADPTPALADAAAGTALPALVSDPGLSVTELGWVERVLEAGLVAGFSELVGELGHNPAGNVRCHQVTHEIGRRSWVMYRDLVTALSFEPNWCGQGYTHGVIEMWGREEYQPGMSRQLADTCRQTGVIGGSECAHGIGHAVMQDFPELEVAIGRCGELYDEMVFDCLDGVLMIYSQNELAPDSLDAGRSDLGFSVVEFCGLLPVRFATECDWIAGPFWQNATGSLDRSKSLAQCLELAADSLSPYRCAFGVGGNVPDTTGWDPNAALDDCNKGPTALVAACVQGAWRVLDHFMELDGQQSVCQRVESRYREVCVSYISGPNPRENERLLATDPGVLAIAVEGSSS